MTRAEQYFVDQIREGYIVYVPQTGQLWRTGIAGKGLLRDKCRLLDTVWSSGYFRLASAGGGGKFMYACQHRVIWEAFVGPIPAGYVINHKDFNKQNNRLSNLEVVTYSENTQHFVDSGRRKFPEGDLNHKTKVKDCQILPLYEKYLQGEITSVEVAKIWGMERSNISRVFRERGKRLLAQRNGA